MHRSLYPQGKSPCVHWLGGWVGPRTSLDAVSKRKIPSPRRDSNPDHPARSQSPYWPSYSYSDVPDSRSFHVTYPFQVEVLSPINIFITFWPKKRVLQIMYMHCNGIMETSDISGIWNNMKHANQFPRYFLQSSSHCMKGQNTAELRNQSKHRFFLKIFRMDILGFEAKKRWCYGSKGKTWPFADNNTNFPVTIMDVSCDHGEENDSV
jgi:hypothetical protein